MERVDISKSFPLGSSIPQFSLLNVDDDHLGSDYLTGAKAYLVAFLCNHCPYVKGSESMLIEVVKRFEKDGLKTVAISSNDATKYPEDGFEKMQDKAALLQLPYPYLYDETQEVARAFDAACTPELYLFDGERRLFFHGAINDSPRDPAKVTKEYLSEAIVAVLEGQIDAPRFVHPIGCSIKWK
jgi:peroxiredoxin